MLASGRPADDILAELCRGAEAVNPGASAAILVLNRERNASTVPSPRARRWPLPTSSRTSPSARPIWEPVRPLCFVAR
jgi:hypothetical protein